MEDENDKFFDDMEGFWATVDAWVELPHLCAVGIFSDKVRHTLAHTKNENIQELGTGSMQLSQTHVGTDIFECFGHFMVSPGEFSYRLAGSWFQKTQNLDPKVPALRNDLALPWRICVCILWLLGQTL